jgi:hypothetical protein
MFVQLSRSYFSEEIFSWSLSEWLSAQVGVFPKAKTGKHKGEIKTHQRRKNWKAKKSKQKNKKQKYTEGASENLMRQSPGKLKESRKILDDGKGVLLMVSWVRVDSDSFISLLFHLRFS